MTRDPNNKTDNDRRSQILEAIWIRIAYIAAAELLNSAQAEPAVRRICPQIAGCDGNQQESATVNLLAVNLQPLAKTYVQELMRQLIAAHPNSLSLDELCCRITLAGSAQAPDCDTELERLLALATKSQLPYIFRQPQLILLDRFVYRISQPSDGRLTAELVAT